MMELSFWPNPDRLIYLPPLPSLLFIHSVAWDLVGHEPAGIRQ